MTQLIQKEANVAAYFRELVCGAMKYCNACVTDVSEFYIVNLLSEFSKTEKLFDVVAGHYEERPLAIMLAEALQSDRSERIKIYKKLGDTSLYVAGFFSDHVDSKVVDIDYYISMGEGAYKSLSGLFANERTFSGLYDELSEKFILLTDVLSLVRNASALPSNVDIVRMYDRWLRTKDPRTQEMLEREGIITKTADPRKNH